jgi:hypothetical protein
VTDGFNSIAEVLAQDIYPFEDLLRYMRTLNYLFPLKSACLDLIRNACLDVSSKVSGAEEELISKLIGIITTDMEIFFEIK